MENNIFASPYGVNDWGGAINSWDNGSVGNYWSDYQTKCPNASEIGASGIGDIPYVVNANNTDNYPLMAPFEVSSSPSLEPQPEPEPFPTTLAMGALGATIAGVSVCLLYYHKKRKL